MYYKPIRVTTGNLAFAADGRVTENGATVSWYGVLMSQGILANIVTASGAVGRHSRTKWVNLALSDGRNVQALFGDVHFNAVTGINSLMSPAYFSADPSSTPITNLIGPQIYPTGEVSNGGTLEADWQLITNTPGKALTRVLEGARFKHVFDGPLSAIGNAGSVYVMLKSLGTWAAKRPDGFLHRVMSSIPFVDGFIPTKRGAITIRGGTGAPAPSYVLS